MIQTARSLDREVIAVFSLTIVASDDGIPPQNVCVYSYVYPLMQLHQHINFVRCPWLTYSSVFVVTYNVFAIHVTQ